MSAPPSVKVLFLAGTGRCGSTLLSNILGQAPGCFAAGELRFLWERGMTQDHRCGCGRPFSECPVWTSVIADAFADRTVPDAPSMAHRIDSRLRVRRVPIMILRRLLGRRPVKPVPEDEDVLRVYRALSHRPGVTVIVDSSKLPPYALLLSDLPGVELSVVHVVRDPRATAFSWRRHKVTRDRDDGTTMDRLEVWRTAVLWLLWSLATDRWWPRSRPNSILVRYEDLVSDPSATVQRVLNMVGLELPPGVVDAHSVTLAPTHSVAGNPARHDSGRLPLRFDSEWQHAMPRAHRALVTFLTWPGLRRFGYPIAVDGRIRTNQALPADSGRNS